MTGLSVLTTWMTCQPNADLTGARSWPGCSPGAKTAAANAGSSCVFGSSWEKYGRKPLTAPEDVSSLCGARSANDVVPALSASYACCASSCAAVHAGSSAFSAAAPEGSFFGE